jgi:hypothetical protein
VHFEVLANHLAGRRLVIDDDDVLILAHVMTPRPRATRR